MKTTTFKTTIMAAFFLIFLLVNAHSLNSDNTKSNMITGYIIESNEDNTYVIDLGRINKITLDDEFIIYAHDKIISHPIHGNEIRIPGQEVAKGIVKDIYDDFSIITLDQTSLKTKKDIEPGFSVKLIKLDTSDLSFKFKRNRLKKDLKKSVTTVETSFATGFFGDVSVLYQDLFVSYRFPTRLNIFRFELQAAELLSITDIYDKTYEMQPIVHAYANLVFYFDIWQHKGNNGGIGFAAGGGFTQTGFAGNAGLIIGNMNKTGLSVYFYGLWDKTLTTEMTLNIFLFEKNNFGLNLNSKMNYTYWLDNNGRIEQGLKIQVGPCFQIGKSVYLNTFGGITNTISQEFGGIGGIGLKLVF